MLGCTPLSRNRGKSHISGLRSAADLPYFDAVTAQHALYPLMADDHADDGDDDLSTGVATRTRTKTKKPTPYRVLLLNDDYTPMEFVVLVLQRFFRMDAEQATQVMLHVHQRGVGVCGVFTYEVAETKVAQVIEFARQNSHPLQCTLEKA